MLGAILFDLDGTLVDSERENARSIEVVLAERGRPMTDAERDFVVGHGWREIYERLQAGGAFELGFDELKELAADAKERLCGKDGLPRIPGSVDFVRRAAQKVPCAIVSGSSRREIEFCVRTLDLGREIPWYVGAEDVPRGKPAPDGYLIAASKLGLAPERCLVFEDSAAGIAAARAAGMRCVALSTANFLGVDQGAADLLVRDFEDLASEEIAALAERLGVGRARG